MQTKMLTPAAPAKVEVALTPVAARSNRASGHQRCLELGLKYWPLNKPVTITAARRALLSLALALPGRAK
jgi:hypothetical protein